jgi:hypothetical protein
MSQKPHKALVQFTRVYGTYGGGDDRRAPDVLEGYASTRGAAEEAGRGRGWYGGPGRVTEEEAVVIDGKVFVLRYADPIDLDSTKKAADAKLREETIASLTAEQKRVLGLLEK